MAARTPRRARVRRERVRRLLAQPQTSAELLAALTVGFATPQSDTELEGLLTQLAGTGAVERMPT